VQKLIDKNRLSELIQEETFVDEIKTKSIIKPYKEVAIDATNSVSMPSRIHINNGITDIDESQTTDLKVTYDQYDTAGNLIEYTIFNSGVINAIIWGYKQTLPLAKIENATYASIPASLITAVQTASDTGTEAGLLTALTALRTGLPNAMVTTYTHIPLVGVSTITNPKGDKISYTYDGFNRLQFVKDKDGNLLSENQYHYKN
jgi:YD repeat-containing protein